MPIVLRNNGRVMRLASGRVLRIGDDVSCCCGGTCRLCGLFDCPPLSGVSVTLAGVSIRSIEQQTARDLSYIYKFDKSTLDGTFCCYPVTDGDGTCASQFASDPVLTLTLHGPDGDAPGETPKTFAIGVTYDCTGKINVFIGGGIRPDLPENLVAGAPNQGEVFTTTFNGTDTGGVDTSMDWPVGCVRVGFSSENAIPDGSTDQTDNDDSTVYGGGGSVSIDSEC